jgi:hypothetical protein
MIIPGDSFKYYMDLVVRMQPLVAPILQEISFDTHTFFVPIRLVDEDFEESSSGGEDGETTKEFPRWIPDPNPPVKGSLWDYFGHPVTLNDFPITSIAAPFPTAWHLRAYNLIWNEYYRDEHYQEKLDLDQQELQYRAFRKDYFTSALPDTQLGDPLAIPVTGEAHAEFDGDIPYYNQIISRIVGVGTGITPGVNGVDYPAMFHKASIGAGAFDYSSMYASLPNSPASPDDPFSDFLGNALPGSNATANNWVHARPAVKFEQGMLDWLSHNTIQLGTASAFDVNDLRALVQQQKFKERNMRIGTRMTEQLRGRWRVTPEDARLQRPEYISGSRTPIIISEVLQTSQTTQTTPEQEGSPQGNLGGHGLTASTTKTPKYYAKEWGILITIASIMPKVGYSQGINRQWLYESRYDLPAPEYMHLGEREVMQTEIYTTDNEATNRTAIAFRPMYDEHRLKQDMVCNNMRDTFNTWHLSREFDAPPTINENFISTKDNIRKDIFLVHDEPGFIVHVGNRLKMVRSMPKLGEPGLIDHF